MVPSTVPSILSTPEHSMSPMTLEPAAITERLASPLPAVLRASPLPFESLLNIAIARFLRDELHGIQHLPGSPYFEVQVRRSGSTAVSRERDDLAARNADSRLDENLAGVSVKRFVAVHVSKPHGEAVLRVFLDLDDYAPSSGTNGRADRRRDIEPGMRIVVRVGARRSTRHIARDRQRPECRRREANRVGASGSCCLGAEHELHLIVLPLQLNQSASQGVETQGIRLHLPYLRSQHGDTDALEGKERPAGSEKPQHETAAPGHEEAEELHLARSENDRSVRQPAFALDLDDHRSGVGRVDVPVPSRVGRLWIRHSCSRFGPSTRSSTRSRSSAE